LIFVSNLDFLTLKRTIIVEGFGSKMQFFNKLLQWLFSLQVGFLQKNYFDVFLLLDLTLLFKTPFRVYMAIMWWTQFFGHNRYRDMMKPNDIPRSALFQAEFCPMLFLLTEMLWFDTPCNSLSFVLPFLTISS